MPPVRLRTHHGHWRTGRFGESSVNQLQRSFQCAIVARGYRKTWRWPEEVDELLRSETGGVRVLHLFGGRATWGTKLDIDPLTRPTVRGDAFRPPFACGSFDSVIVDPPYYSRTGQDVWATVLRPAACLARRTVWWFSEDSAGGHHHGLKLNRWWVVLTGDNHRPRLLCEFLRRRHPTGGCFAEKMPAAIAKYRWRS